MRSLVSASLATAVALLLAANVHADDLVLELTTKLGDDETVVIVAKVNTGDEGGALFVADQLRAGLPGRLFKSDKKYLALRPSPSQIPGAHYPAMLIAIPWQSIKEIGRVKEISTVTCVDGAKFTGTILTEVTDTNKKQYHMKDCTKVTVKKVTKSEEKAYAGPVAKCSVRFNGLVQSFDARRLAYRTGNETSEKFQMRVDGEISGDNLSNFAKVEVEGSEKGEIKITVKTPKGKETKGELGFDKGATFLFEGANDCAIVLRLRAQDSFGGPAQATPATFALTIESTKAGERLSPKLFIPLEKK